MTTIKKKTGPNLDRLNLRILGSLCDHGRIPYTELAKDLRLSINTVRDRIIAMENRGVIRGYRAIVDEQRMGMPFRALALLEATGPTRATALQELLEDPMIRSAYRSNGRYDLVLEMVGQDFNQLQRTLERAVYPLGYGRARLVPLGRPPHDLAKEEVAQVEIRQRSPEEARILAEATR